jgi:hypothetical protein
MKSNYCSREVSREYNEYLGDVWYEVWRRGGNPDIVDDDRVIDRYYDGYDSDESAALEIRSQNRYRGEEDE